MKGSPVQSTFDGSQGDVYNAEREFAEAIIYSASVQSDCYNFAGLLEDTTDIISELRETS